MRSLFTVISLILIVVPALAGQPYGESFTLGVGESVELGEGELIIGFEGILSDSRCPLGVWCFWPGDAAADLWARFPGEEPLDFVLHTYYDYEQSIELEVLTVGLEQVDPYPVIDVPIDPDTYVVQLVVHQGTVGIEARSWGVIKALYR